MFVCVRGIIMIAHLCRMKLSLHQVPPNSTLVCSRQPKAERASSVHVQGNLGLATSQIPEAESITTSAIG